MTKEIYTIGDKIGDTVYDIPRKLAGFTVGNIGRILGGGAAFGARPHQSRSIVVARAAGRPYLRRPKQHPNFHWGTFCHDGNSRGQADEIRRPGQR